MGIIKVEISLPEAAKALEEFRREPKKAFELISNEVKEAVSNLFDQLLQTEMSIFLGQKVGYLNCSSLYSYLHNIRLFLDIYSNPHLAFSLIYI